MATSKLILSTGDVVEYADHSTDTVIYEGELYQVLESMDGTGYIVAFDQILNVIGCTQVFDGKEIKLYGDTAEDIENLMQEIKDISHVELGVKFDSIHTHRGSFWRVYPGKPIQLVLDLDGDLIHCAFGHNTTHELIRNFIDKTLDK